MNATIEWSPVSYYFGPGLAATDAAGRLLEVVPFARSYGDAPEGYLFCVAGAAASLLATADLEAAREAAEARIRAVMGP